MLVEESEIFHISFDIFHLSFGLETDDRLRNREMVSSACRQLTACLGSAMTNEKCQMTNGKCSEKRILQVKTVLVN